MEKTETKAGATAGKPAHPLIAEPPLPGHLIALPGARDWALWRWSLVRSAGFPVHQVLALAAPESSAAADRLLDLEAKTEKDRQALLSRLRQEIRQASDKEERKTLTKAKRRIRQGRRSEWREAGSLHEAETAVELARESFIATFQREHVAIGRELRRVARSDLLQEAILWQNRQAFHRVTSSLLHASPGLKTSRIQQNERLIARYLQRYCTKNETIGFFGPHAFARWVDDGSPMVLRLGGRLLANRTVFFEGWAVDELAAKLAENRALRPWLLPRRLPLCRLEDGAVSSVLTGRVELSQRQVEVLRSCDGTRTAQELARLIRERDPEVVDDSEVYDVLDELLAKDLVAWNLDVPLCLRPEKELRKLLLHIEEDELRQPALDKLGELETARRQVSLAAGNVSRLDSALDHLEKTFTRVTGKAPTRAAGRTYAARTLVFEDTSRDVTMKLGPELLAELAPPLSLLLTSARWLTFEVARAYRQALDEIYCKLVAEKGTPVVEFSDMWFRSQRLVHGRKAGLLEGVLCDFDNKWLSVLPELSEKRRVSLSVDELKPRVDAAFTAPQPGWRMARYHSPDVMIAAADVGDINRGNYYFVLGEFHPAINTLSAESNVAQHPRPAELYRAIASDLPESRFEPMVARHWPGANARLKFSLFLEKDYRLLISGDPPDVPGPQVLPLSELIVEDCSAGLQVRTRDGAVRFDAIESLSSALFVRLASAFKVLPVAEHRPRLCFDKLVVCRESWRFRAADVSFAYAESAATRFLGARRWSQRHGMPRFVFLKTPTDRKPFFVDLESPMYVDNLASEVRKVDAWEDGATILITEMLPHPGQVWLPDVDGGAYCSELRLVALDRCVRSDPAWRRTT